MAKIEVGQFSQLFRRLLAMKGQVDVASELAPEISPVFVIESQRPEWEFLKGYRLISCVTVVAGVAAVQSTSRIRNPANSGVIAEISFFSVSTDLPTIWNVFLNNQTVDLATPFPLIPVTRDTREILRTSALVASGDNVVGVGSNIATGRVLANTTDPTPLPFVLTPGNSVDLNTETVNCSHRWTVAWRERKLYDLEAA